MLRLMITVVLLIQVGLIGFSGQMLLTGSAEVPGLHVAMLFVNVVFGALNVFNLVRA